jgi:hypothetical protein
MTYRDPAEPTYRDPADPLPKPAPGTNPPRYTEPARRDAWGAGSILGIIVVLVLVVGAIAYAMNRGSDTTAVRTGPSATQSAPTTGQGSSGVGGSTSSGTAR